MQPPFFWTRFPDIPRPPAPPSRLELAQLQSAVDQATWTRYGVIAQVLAAVTAGLAIYFTYRAAAEAKRQADAAWRQLDAERARASAESMVAAYEFLADISKRFRPLFAGEWNDLPGAQLETETRFILLRAHRQSFTREAMEEQTDPFTREALAAHGLRFVHQVSAPHLFEAWLAVLDAMELVEEAQLDALRIGTVYESTEAHDLREALRTLLLKVITLKGILELASRPVRDESAGIIA